MERIEIRNRDRDAVLGRRIAVADGWWSRLRGMLGRPEPEAGEGLLLVPCSGVHMFGMSYPLDVLLLDEDRRVVACYPELEPWKRSAFHSDARYALELPAGTAEETGTRKGDVLEW